MKTNKIESNHAPMAGGNYLTNITVGAVTGYAAKYLLPLTRSETNDVLIKHANIYRNNARVASNKVIKSVKNTATQTPATDLFVKFADKGAFKDNLAQYHKLDEINKMSFQKMIRFANDAARDARKLSTNVAIAITKKIRPTAAFVAPGVILGFASTLVYNITRHNKTA